MRLDMPAMRTVLEALERAPEGYVLRPEAVTELHPAVARTHLRLAIEAGLADGRLHRMNDGAVHCVGLRLTYPGHELLARMRSPEVWKRIGDAAIERGLELTVETVRVLGAEVMRALASHGGGA